jgi:carbon starvation protein CstA
MLITNENILVILLLVSFVFIPRISKKLANKPSLSKKLSYRKFKLLTLIICISMYGSKFSDLSEFKIVLIVILLLPLAQGIFNEN